MSATGWRISIALLLLCNAATGQRIIIPPDSISKIKILSINQRLIKGDDSIIVNSGICKVLKTTVLKRSQNPWLNDTKSKPAFLTIHGNVQYDFLYRSYLDTPLYQRDFRQHTVKTNFNLVFKQAYPVQVTLLHRNSNSPYFRDITDVSVQFSQREYLKNLKENMSRQAVQKITAGYALRYEELIKGYNARAAKVEALQQWLSSPARIQELIAEKERSIKATLPGILPGTPVGTPSGTPTVPTGELPNVALPPVAMPNGVSGLPQVPQLPQLPTLPDEEVIQKAIAAKLKGQLTSIDDSILAKVNEWISAKKKLAADSAQHTKTAEFIELKRKELVIAKQEAADYEKKIKGVKKSLADSLTKVKQEIARLKSTAELKNFIQQKKMNAGELTRGWKVLGAVRSVGIGRSWVDYSELTVKNISLTGVNIEINPGNIYLAAAAGRINYRFRDFVVNNSFQPKQSLYLLRAGVGKKEGNNFILTWYDGRRNLIQSFSTPAVSPPLERVIGVSAETRIQINENQFIIAEFAKSSFHNTGTINEAGHTLFRKVSNFKDRSNEGYSIKLSSYWPEAGTKVTGYYKKMGEHFQSFNLQPVNSVQEAFHIKVQQHLWKKKFTVDAAVRKNDFSNPFINPGISSSTVFKSLQLGLRIPKYPFVTIGYAPSSQLTVLDNQRLVENQYNTLNAVVSYSYKTKKTSMVTNAMFLKFYNNSPDTGFIYYNAASFSLTQLVYLGNWQLQSGLTITDQQELRVLTLDQSVTWQLKQWLSLTGGFRYNRIHKGSSPWGGTAGVNMLIKKIGSVQLSYDKSYLPGTTRNLLPVETGRVSYYRSF